MCSIPWTTWLILLGFVVVGWFWIFGHHGLYEMEQLRKVRSELLDEKENQEEERQKLESELQHLQEPEYVKHLIHKELGYVEEGEMVIQFPK